MKVNLQEIPAEGREYYFTKKHGKIDLILNDLIQNQNYTFEFKIKPMGNAYEIKGHFNSQGSEVCSLCGVDFLTPLAKKIDEYVVVEEQRPRKTHATHGNQSLNLDTQGPETTYINSYIFDLGEFLHEQLALSWPLYPECGQSECETRAEELRAQFTQDSESSESHGHPGFALLKNLRALAKN